MWPEPCAAVAAYGLPGRTLALPRAPVDASAWPQVLSTAVHERITGHLAHAIETGALPVTDRQAEDVGLAHRASMATAVLLERTLLRTVELLDDAGIEHRVLKGTAVAHLDYPDPSLRSFGDNDLLVRSSQFDAAVFRLAAAGHRRRFPEPRPGFDRRFGKGSCLVAADGYELDLHRTLAMGPFGLRIRLDDLWSQPSRFTVGGRSLDAPSPEVRFLHSCLHAVLGDRFARLATLRDVAQMERCGSLDVDRVLGVGAAWRAEAVVARALRLAAELLGLAPTGPLGEWALAYEPSAEDRRALAVYDTSDASYAGKSFAAVRAIPGLRDKLAFVYALVLPTREYRQKRQEGRLERLRRGVSQVARSERIRKPHGTKEDADRER